MESKFKVGQVWETREGGQCAIAAVSSDGMLTTASGLCFWPDGKWYAEGESETDLVRLFSEAPLMIPSFISAPDNTDLERFRALHAKLSTKNPLPPFPAIIISGEHISVIGIDGYRIGGWDTSALNEMKAATGYPVYSMREILFDAVYIMSYEVQQ